MDKKEYEVIRGGCVFKVTETPTRLDIYAEFSRLPVVEVHKPGILPYAVVSWSACGQQAAGHAGEFAAAVQLAADLAAEINCSSLKGNGK